MAEQGCIQKFCQGRANLGYGKKRGGRKLTIVLCEAQGGGVLHPTLAICVNKF